MHTGGEQWLFLADDSCSDKDDELMAVKLLAPQDLLLGSQDSYSGTITTLWDAHSMSPDTQVVCSPILELPAQLTS